MRRTDRSRTAPAGQRARRSYTRATRFLCTAGVCAHCTNSSLRTRRSFIAASASLFQPLLARTKDVRRIRRSRDRVVLITRRVLDVAQAIVSVARTRAETRATRVETSELEAS